MEFDVSAGAVVNAGGALIFVLEGIAILVIGRSRRTFLVGGLALFFGLTYILDNILPLHPLKLFFIAPALVCCLLLVAHLGAGLNRWAKRAIQALAILFGLAVAAIFVETVQVPLPYIPPDLLGQMNVLSNLAMGSAAGLLTATCAALVRGSNAGARQDRRALVALAVSFGLWMAFSQMMVLPFLPIWHSPVAVTLALIICLLTLVCVICWCPTARSPEPALARNTFLLLAGGALVGILVSPRFAIDPTVFGLFGIMRTIGAVFLALAVVKYDLLGVPLPHVVVKRGVVAGAALAILFIVAQVAQNFFSAQYGLLGGGVIAGTFLFAASPVQRAFEGARNGLRGNEPKTTVRRPRGEKLYREALRIALVDRKVTKEEELHLFQLAEELGLGAGRAFELRQVVEREVR